MDEEKFAMAAYEGDFGTILDMMRRDPSLGAYRGRRYNLMHQIGYHGASKEVVDEVCGYENIRGQLEMVSEDGDPPGTPEEIAEKRGFATTAHVLRDWRLRLRGADVDESRGADVDESRGAVPGAAGGESVGPTSGRDRYLASMLFSAAGDALGYMNGHWEFNYSAMDLEKELAARGGWAGLENIPEKMRVSDDTVMHLATAEALERVVGRGRALDVEAFGEAVGARYVACWADMGGRGPGNTCARFVAKMASGSKWDEAAPVYEGKKSGCGAAMRSMCIGLCFPKEEQMESLIAAGVESARVTHNHVCGILSSVVSAAFTAYALNDIPVETWPRLVIERLVPATKAYVLSRASPKPAPEAVWARQERRFTKPFQMWLDGDPMAKMSVEDLSDPAIRDERYNHFGGGWDATSAIIISYEAFRNAGDDWNKFATFAGIHGGDSDSTFCIAGAWFGAKYGFHPSVPPQNYERVEYHERCKHHAKTLYELNQ